MKKIKISPVVYVIIILIILIYGVISVFSRLAILEMKVEELEKKTKYLEEEYNEIWLNIDALSEYYTLLYNEIYRGNN